MRITYHGTDVVDIPGRDNVQPGETVEVDNDVGASLLAAGSSIADDGTITAPAKPLWTASKAKTAAEPAGKDEQ